MTTERSGVSEDVGVLVAAAGKGERAGGEPKQFRPIAGVPMLLRAVRPFAQHPRVRQIVVALPPGVVATPPEWLAQLMGGRLALTAGGETRAESVLRALAVLDGACEIVLVHDAARPFVSADTVDAVIGLAAEGGAVPAIPVSDTVKRVERGSDRVIETVDRRDLWRAQTPQGFPRRMLEQAYERLSAQDLTQFTDESALVEAAGFGVRIVPDVPTNIKVTTPDDFRIAGVLATP